MDAGAFPRQALLVASRRPVSGEWSSEPVRGTTRHPKSARLGSLVADVPTSFDNAPSTSNRGSAWNNVGAYSWISRDLGKLLGQQVATPMSQGYCGKGVLADCRNELRQTLTQAVQTLTAQQKTSDPAKWTYDKSRDDIQFQFVGETVKPIDWQNRSTFQQVVG